MDDDDTVVMMMVQDSESKEGMTAGAELLSQLRQLTAGLDIVRTARIKVRQEDGLTIFGEPELAAWVSVGSLLAYHVTGQHNNL